MPRTTKTAAKAAESTNGSKPSANESANDTNSTPNEEAALNYEEAVAQAKSWVAENQGLAMLGAFGVGVFFGVMLRR